MNFLIHLKIFKSMFAVDVEAPVSYFFHGGCTYELLAVMSWFGCMKDSNLYWNLLHFAAQSPSNYFLF